MAWVVHRRAADVEGSRGAWGSERVSGARPQGPGIQPERFQVQARAPSPFGRIQPDSTRAPYAGVGGQLPAPRPFRTAAPRLRGCAPGLDGWGGWNGGPKS